MAAPLLVFLFALVACVAFGQDSAPVKAGDRAPEIDWTKIMQSPESAKYQPSLTGQYTVLQFLPPVTPNAQAIDHWNELIAEFRDQPVQFVWIASEKWSVSSLTIAPCPVPVASTVNTPGAATTTDRTHASVCTVPEDQYQVY
jgi:hypothetical protein